MSDNIQQLESEALRLLVEGDDPTLADLRQQVSRIVGFRREHTGVGSYLNFMLPENCPRLPGNPSFAIADVYCEAEGSELGASVVLFIEDGLISLLDIASFGDYWPQSIGQFVVSYQNAGGRDLEALRRTPGWPVR